MQRNIFSKTFSLNALLRKGFNKNFKSFNPKFAMTLISGSALSLGLNCFSNPPQICQQSASQPISSSKLLLPEDFSDAKYEEALKNKEDIIVIFDPERRNNSSPS